MAVLLSPVAWIHHLHWMVVVVFAVLGADPRRDRRRLVAAAVLIGWFLCRMPWWGISWLNHPEWPELPGRMLQNADVFGALLALELLSWSLDRGAAPGPGSAQDAGDLQGRQPGDEQADDAADPPHRREVDAGEQRPAEQRGQA
jgi:alpha-1,2-mannosyltransferase